jgi:hypothetical protein
MFSYAKNAAFCELCGHPAGTLFHDQAAKPKEQKDFFIMARIFTFSLTA